MRCGGRLFGPIGMFFGLGANGLLLSLVVVVLLGGDGAAPALASSVFALACVCSFGRALLVSRVVSSGGGGAAARSGTIRNVSNK
jgi:hypothetical protein